MSQICVFESHEKFYGSQEHIKDDELLGRPSTSQTDVMLKFCVGLAFKPSPKKLE